MTNFVLKMTNFVLKMTDFALIFDKDHGGVDEVSFQLKNPDFLLKNDDFLLKNVDFIIKQLIGSHIVSLVQENPSSGDEDKEAAEAEEEVASNRPTHLEKLLAAYDETSSGQGGAAADQTVDQILSDLCDAVEEVIEAPEIKAGDDW